MAKTQKRSPITRLLSAVTALSSTAVMLPALPNLSAAAAEYNIIIAGTKVTSVNASDVLGDGVFSYDAYTKTLTVDGDCTSTNCAVIESSIEYLTINVASNSCLATNINDDRIKRGIDLKAPATIAGSGKLTVGSYESFAIAAKDLTITNPAVTVAGAQGNRCYSGFYIDGDLNISHCVVTSTDCKHYAISSEGDINISDSSITAVVGLNGSAIFAEGGDINISDSSITAVGGPNGGIYSAIYAAKNLNITNSSINADGARYGIECTNEISITHSDIDAVGTDAALWSGSRLTLTDCSITLPQHGYVDGNTINDADDVIAKAVKIEKNAGPVIESYDLFISGQQVNDDNAEDILGDGTLSYNAATQTLTMNGARINNDEYSILSDLDDLTINVASDSIITNTAAGKAAVKSNGNLTITGSGKLTIQANYIAVYVPDANLTIKDANIDATGRYGLTGKPFDEKLTVINSRIHAAGIKGAISDFGDGIELRDCAITAPAGAYILNDDIVTESGSVAEEVTIVPDKFDLQVAGTQVTAQNAADILGNGVCSFDALTNTLTISGNYTMNDTLYFIYNRINDLIIKVASDSVINVTKSCSINSSGHNMTITGPGKLTMDGYIYTRC